MFSLFNALALISLFSQMSFADSNLFSDFDDATAPLSSISDYEDFDAITAPFLPLSDDQETNGDLITTNLFSSCPEDSNPNLSKLRIRNPACPNDSDVPLHVPDLSNLLNSIEEPLDPSSSTDPVSALEAESDIGGDYCRLFTSDPSTYLLPVCLDPIFGKKEELSLGKYMYIVDCDPSKSLWPSFPANLRGDSVAKSKK